MTPDAFEKFAASIAALNGLSMETAQRYAAIIGDTPEMDRAGLVLVRDRKSAIVARLRLN